MRLFRPAQGPLWLENVLQSVERAMGQRWSSPVLLQDFATADLPSATSYTGGVVYDTTVADLKYSDGTNWKRIPAVLSYSTTYDPPSLASGASGTIQTLAATGVALGDIVAVSFSNDLAGATVHAWVSAADTIKYFVRNTNGANPLDLASGTLRFRVSKA